MTINLSIFKEYDIRGTYPSEISPYDAVKIGNAFSQFLNRLHHTSAPNILIGRDTRASSDILRQNLVEGIIAAGGNCFDLGVATSPQLVFSALTRVKAHGGVMITASHNPASFNGFKFAIPKVGWIGMRNGMNKIMKFALRKKSLAKKELGAISMVQGDADRYIRRLHQIVPQIGSVRTLIDAAGGAASFLLPKLLAKYPLVYKPLFFNPDPTFRSHPANPLSPEVDKIMAEEARRGKYQMGAAFDGDADRVAFFDERGKRIRADIIFAILAREALKKRSAKNFLFELTHSRFLQPFIESYGGRLYTSRVGRTFVPEEMARHRAALAGETSAHIYHRELFNIDCGLLTMLKMLRVVSKSSQPISQIVKSLSTSAFDQLAMPVKNSENALRKVEKRYKPHIISRLDGVSVQFSSYWFNIRMSNTESLARLTIDADSSSELDLRVREIKDLIGAK